MLDACAPHSRWIDVFCDRGAFDADQTREILRAGMARGLAPRVHANQLQHGPGIQVAVEVGAASADHCTHTTDADLELLAGSDTVATLLPGAEFSTRSTYPDARRMLDAGVTVAIATDCNPGSSYTTSIPFCIAVAVRDMRMTPDEALWSATAGGARALRRRMSAGSRLAPAPTSSASTLPATSTWRIAPASISSIASGARPAPLGSPHEQHRHHPHHGYDHWPTSSPWLATTPPSLWRDDVIWRPWPPAEPRSRLWPVGDVPVYGISTGFGALANRHIPVEDRVQLQRSLIRSHAAGMGPAVEREVVRALILLRLKTLSSGRTGARPVVAETMAALLNAGITPVVHEFGSLGCSGDLAPLSHCALVLMGEGRAVDRDGTERPVPELLEEAGIESGRTA